MSQMMQESALILSNDARDPDALQTILAANGYSVYTVESVDGDVERTLLETSASLVLTHIDLKRDTLAQPDDVAVLGLLLREPSYGEQHVVMILTRTPDVVETVLGPVLERLGIPVLALPCTLEEARATLTQAHDRHKREAAPTVH
jgi:hypothetical protein